MAVPNPIAFRPKQVTFWTALAYLALLIPLIIVHETVPAAPSPEKLQDGLNLVEAWSDLATLSRAYHPYNSRENDVVRKWLLERISAIKSETGAHSDNLVIFDDKVNNITMAGDERAPKPLQGPDFHPKTIGTYFEANNIAVYIRGKQDPAGSWWESDSKEKPIGKGGVLVNAHFDSVSTGFGATDDGMAVVSILQLIKYFSLEHNQPERGIVALLNNNEEDWLWGARAFGYHPLMPFCHVFLNLEGAAAGGKANLFRTTDAEVTRAYQGGTNPFGSVVFSDAWQLGVIRSGTDYSVFHDIYGMRGLDLAFYRPRARYHTNQDDTRHTSVHSLWHMLSHAVHTTSRLSGDTGETFLGERPDQDQSKVSNGSPSDGVWFDLFGKAFIMVGLNDLFAWSVSLLVVTPLALILLSVILARCDKFYFFSSKKSAQEDEGVSVSVALGGLKGIVRFPFALLVAGALVVGSAYLLKKINPFVIYSHEYTVWAMMLSLFYFTFWVIVAAANFSRPSALHRGYALLWLFLMTWAFLVAVTVYEHQRHIAAGYPFVFLQSAVFLATLLSLLELSGLPKKSAFAQKVYANHSSRESLGTEPDNQAESQSEPGAAQDGDEQGDEATEDSPLIGGSSNKNRGSTFGTVYRRPVSSSENQSSAGDGTSSEPFGHEQPWSGKLPSWLWFFQFLLIGPFFFTVFGQLGLALVASVKETGADGGSTLIPYLLVAITSILLVLPITPFAHRITHHIPLLLLVVFAATLTYNLIVFPFSASSRYKIYFSQDVNLDTGESFVHLMGVEEYVRQAMAVIPSAMNSEVSCEAKASDRPDMGYCTYNGSTVLPQVGPRHQNLTDWISFNATRDSHKLHFEIDGVETRVCGVRFPEPVSKFQVKGGNPVDSRFGAIPKSGLDSIMLYRRDWDKPWAVEVEWPAGIDLDKKIDVEVFCKWNDANKQGAIPALDQALQYTPDWVAITKLNDGLVYGNKSYTV
ncbi:hypothetical protein PFICI_06121 [Pestalotiopsis fici W106-1]|uniref:Peptide hydrolase n=1 Tax=Pestalotiopsis fici (strain W106-1 / CGMCC3.15140) TaxID=1229662 RepID=W3X531_PESFW|nr:uncharacterized protein PFICI_06121 [Pestalotiopsis fici W106-1]ETS81119.1 hypothetical protein PFICI_06121 [Pestalotiopsis fici W106-1]